MLPYLGCYHLGLHGRLICIFQAPDRIEGLHNHTMPHEVNPAVPLSDSELPSNDVEDLKVYEQLKKSKNDHGMTIQSHRIFERLPGWTCQLVTVPILVTVPVCLRNSMLSCQSRPILRLNQLFPISTLNHDMRIGTEIKRTDRPRRLHRVP